MTYKIETHCHSEYSFDSALSIETIIEKCNQIGIQGIVLCDHDKCSVTIEDEKLFEKGNIRLFKAIEFTTFEGIHIIGISSQIKALEKESHFYTIRELIKYLNQINAAIIIPHPFHETGLMGNKVVNSESCKYALTYADYIEVDNYRYGESSKICNLMKEFENLTGLIGSDAHAANSIAAYYNSIEVSEIESFKFSEFKDIVGKNINKTRRLCHTRWYWHKKNIKRSRLYQWILHLFPAEFRRKLKNSLFNK